MTANVATKKTKAIENPTKKFESKNGEIFVTPLEFFRQDIVRERFNILIFSISQFNDNVIIDYDILSFYFYIAKISKLDIENQQIDG